MLAENDDLHVASHRACSSGLTALTFTERIAPKQGEFMKTIYLALILSTTAAVAGCASTSTKPVTQRNGQLTTGNVELNLKVGVTTKSQVIDHFGPPNITTTNASGREEWVYQRQATVSQSATHSNYWTIILAGGNNSASGFSQTQRTMTLIIAFDKNGTVSNFRSRASQF